VTPDDRQFLKDAFQAMADEPLPRGVSALVGPNGSGKTTLLDVPELLRHTLAHGARKAVDDRGGPGTLRNLQVDRSAPVILGIELDALAWQLDLSPRGAAFNPLQGERVTLGGTVVLDRAAAEGHPDDDRPFLRRHTDLADGAELRPLVALLERRGRTLRRGRTPADLASPARQPSAQRLIRRPRADSAFRAAPGSHPHCQVICSMQKLTGSTAAPATACTSMCGVAGAAARAVPFTGES
jgi:hypothetical protein